MALLDDVGEKGVHGLPLPSLDAKFFICGKELEVRDALSLAMPEQNLSLIIKPSWQFLPRKKWQVIGTFQG